jgi:hypothetical protein
MNNLAFNVLIVIFIVASTICSLLTLIVTRGKTHILLRSINVMQSGDLLFCLVSLQFKSRV